MALGAITVLRRFKPSRGVRRVLVELTGEAAYTASGVPIAASVFGLNAITTIIPFPVYPLANRQYIWDRANGTLWCRVPSTGAEANGNLSADKIVLEVIGS